MIRHKTELISLHPQTGYKFLSVGEVFVARGPTKIVTILGSCISVIMFVPKLKMAAICHAQLPSPFPSEANCKQECPIRCYRKKSGNPSDLKFVSCSIDFMLSELRKISVAPADINVSLVGGAHVLNSSIVRPSIGEQNLNQAIKILSEHKLPVQYQDVGGYSGRKITYHSDSNILKVIHLNEQKTNQSENNLSSKRLFK